MLVCSTCIDDGILCRGKFVEQLGANKEVLQTLERYVRLNETGDEVCDHEDLLTEHIEAGHRGEDNGRSELLLLHEGEHAVGDDHVRKWDNVVQRGIDEFNELLLPHDLEFGTAFLVD